MSEPIPEPPPADPLAVARSRRTGGASSTRMGNAVLLQGDAAWSLIANTTLDEARRYIEDRRRKGFNTLIVSLIEYCFAQDPPRNLAGDEPFTTPGDFRTPNEAYMAHAERVLDIAAENGMLVILAPAYLGYPMRRPGLRGASRGLVRGSARQRSGGLPGLGRLSGPALRPLRRTSSGASAATAIRARRPPASTSSRGASAPPASTTSSPPTSCRSTRRSMSSPSTTGSISTRPTPTTSSIASCMRTGSAIRSGRSS